MFVSDIDLTAPLDGLGYERRDHMAIITLARPDRGNSLTPRMHEAMKAIWADVREDPWIRVAIITGEGPRHFCTGADVSAVAERGSVNTGDGPLSDAVRWSPRQNEVWKPVICAVNGIASGAGLHFVVDSDIVIASENAAFMDTHVNVGMVGAIENIGLTRRLPLGSALRITLMGKSYRMAADRAYQLGLVDELVEGEELMSVAETMAQAMLQGSPTAMALSQQALWRSLDTGLEAGMEYGWALLRMHWGHPDFVEGPRAFSERRAPDWTQGGPH